MSTMKLFTILTGLPITAYLIWKKWSTMRIVGVLVIVTTIEMIIGYSMFGSEIFNKKQEQSVVTEQDQNEDINTVAAQQEPQRPELISLFNTKISKSQREELARQYVVGEYHNAFKSIQYSITNKVTNYTFDSDGTLKRSVCKMFGEVSERSFEPQEVETWTVSEKRYADTGMIYFEVNVISPVYPKEYTITREHGLLIRNHVDDLTYSLKNGHTTECE